MPAAIGLHPYFPLTPGTRYRGRHRGVFATLPDGLPERLTLLDAPAEWFADRPIARCDVDTVHADRDGPLSIAWPEHGVVVVMHPDPIFAFTGIFVQPDHGFLCTEPMERADRCGESAAKNATHPCTRQLDRRQRSVQSRTGRRLTR